MSSPTVRQRLTNSMLFYPNRGQWRTPAHIGMVYDSIILTAKDGTRTEAWWIPAPPTKSTGAPTLLFFHGNAGTIADRLENAGALRGLGINLLMAEYRGYGNSKGTPSEEGLYLDADAALAEARRRADGAKVIVFGRSLGGAVAIDLCSRHKVDGLVLESTFTSLEEMAGKTGIPFARKLVAYKFESERKIGKIEAPILIFHGTRDELIPFGMGERLRDAASGSSQLTFHPVEGGSHNDTWLVGGKAYWKAWRRFQNDVQAAALKALLDEKQIADEVEIEIEDAPEAELAPGAAESEGAQGPSE